MCCLFVAALRHLSGRCGQSATRQIRVCQRQQLEHLRLVLSDASVAHFAMAELALHNAKDTLDLGTDRAMRGPLPGLIHHSDRGSQLVF